MGKQHYASDIILGEKYVDKQTGFEGTATSITFFQYACERIQIENYDAARKEVKTEVFDAPRLTNLRTDERAQVSRSGGPQLPNAQRGTLAR